MATLEEVSFEPMATPNFPKVAGRWAMVWMEPLLEVPSGAHAYQVPFYRWASEQALQDKVDEVEAAAEAAHPGCPDMKIVVSRGSGNWEGMAGIHAEGSV
jgi:hypothetical protein